MPITLSTLFCTPNDVWDLLSVAGVDLREDDDGLASGQVIQTTALASAGATSLAVLPTPVALLAGAQLTFSGGGMAAPVTVQLASATSAGATSLTVAAIADDVAS